jgi:alpha-D-xyloside xylohydrolase
MLYYNQLRYKLMPYIYTLAGKTYHDDYTIMRPLFMDFSKDSVTKNIGDQFMFGPSLLINPVYHYKERSKDLYLPSGTGWYDLYSGKYFNGGQRIAMEAAYERMPVFVKEGSIVGPNLEYTSQKVADTITLRIYTGSNAEFNLYEDEDVNYNYEKGLFTNIPIIYTESKKQLTLAARSGGFPGMLMNRVFKIVKITKDKPMALDNASGSPIMIHYSGSPVIIDLDKSNR